MNDASWLDLTCAMCVIFIKNHVNFGNLRQTDTAYLIRCQILQRLKSAENYFYRRRNGHKNGPMDMTSYEEAKEASEKDGEINNARSQYRCGFLTPIHTLAHPTHTHTQTITTAASKMPVFAFFNLITADRRTDGRLDKASFRVAHPQLKTS